MKTLVGFLLAFLLISIPVSEPNKIEGGAPTRSAPGVGGGHIPARWPRPASRAGPGRT